MLTDKGIVLVALIIAAVVCVALDKAAAAIGDGWLLIAAFVLM